MYTSQRQSLFIRDNPILSSEKVLHKDYDRKGSVVQKKKKESGCELQGASLQDYLISGKPPVIKESSRVESEQLEQ
jgi:hypothetical protein